MCNLLRVTLTFLQARVAKATQGVTHMIVLARWSSAHFPTVFILYLPTRLRSLKPDTRAARHTAGRLRLLTEWQSCI